MPDLGEEYTSFRKRSDRATRLQRHQASPGRKFSAGLKEWLIMAVSIFAIMSLLNIFVFNISMVKGHSMQPTLYEGERLFINKIALAFERPKRGDVIVLHDPSSGPSRKEYLVKRVVAIPGDVVEVRDHKLYINGKPSEEQYVDTSIEDDDFAPVTVGKDQFFVMGDNRHAGASKDSRYFGAVPLDLVVGRVSFIWWPLSKIHAL